VAVVNEQACVAAELETYKKKLVTEVTRPARVKSVDRKRRRSENCCHSFAIIMKHLTRILLAAFVLTSAYAKDIKILCELAVDKDSKAASSFASDTPKIYAFFATVGTKKGDELRSVWIAVDVGDAAPANTKLDEATVIYETDNDEEGVFSLSRPTKGWPVGDYKVEIYHNDKLVAAPEFAITPAGSSFAGTWNTNLGPLKLRQDGTSVVGEYSGESAGTIEGKIVNGSLEYTWKQANGQEGSGVFSLGDGGNSIGGTWSTKGSTEGGEWTGKRASAQ